MLADPSGFAVFPTAAAVLSGVLAVMAWDRRPARGATAFAVAMASLTLWSAAYVVDLLATEPDTMLLFGKVSYIGIVVFPVAWFLFAVAYTGRSDWIDPVTVGVLLIVPTLIAGSVWLLESVDLVIRSVVPVVVGDGIALDYHYGSFYWVHVAYSYLLIIAGFGLLVRSAFSRPKHRGFQVISLVLAGLPPIVGNLLFFAGSGPFEILDPTSLGLAIAGVPIFLAFFRLGFLSLSNAAHERVFERLEDPIFLLDAEHRVRDCNPAAEALIGRPAASIEGLLLPEVLPGGELLFQTGDERAYRDRIELDVDDASRTYAVSLSSLYYPQQDVMGRLATLKAESDGP